MVLDLEQNLGNPERRTTPNNTNKLGYVNQQAAIPNQIHMYARLTRDLSKPHNQKLNLKIHLGDSLIKIFVSKAAVATPLFLHKI